MAGPAGLKLAECEAELHGLAGAACGGGHTVLLSKSIYNRKDGYLGEAHMSFPQIEDIGNLEEGEPW